MEQQQLFEEVKSWLEAEKAGFQPNPEISGFEGVISTEQGLAHVRLLCEESPAMLQVLCAMPMKVPAEKTNEVALFLHNLNVSLRMGAFALIAEQRLVVFRLTMPIRAGSDLTQQFGEALGTALSTWDDHLPQLGLLVCSVDRARKALSKFAAPTEPGLKTTTLPESRRLDLN
jgi:hypothetical protein